MQKLAKNENISESKEKNKQSDQPRDVTNHDTEADDETLDPGMPFPDPEVKE